MIFWFLSLTDYLFVSCVCTLLCCGFVTTQLRQHLKQSLFTVYCSLCCKFLLAEYWLPVCVLSSMLMWTDCWLIQCNRWYYCSVCYKNNSWRVKQHRAAGFFSPWYILIDLHVYCVFFFICSYVHVIGAGDVLYHIVSYSVTWSARYISCLFYFLCFYFSTTSM